jgi:hypothetical protein
MSKVIRISRHPLDNERKAALRAAFGDDVEIVTTDIPYGDDPVARVGQLIEELGGEEVVAVEAQAPFPVTMKLVDANRKLGVKFIRAEFKRGEDGRAVVVGKDDNDRDILAFDRYVELRRIVIDTAELD